VSRLQTILALVAGGTGLGAFGLGLVAGAPVLFLAAAALSAATLGRFLVRLPLMLDGAAVILGAAALLAMLPAGTMQPAHFWFGLFSTWGLAWLLVERLAAAIRAGAIADTPFGALIPLIFGLMLLLMWELVTRGAGVPQVLLPPPSQIAARFVASVPILWADFQQTFLKAVLAGYSIGCGAGFVVAILIDRSPFLKRGLLPIGNFVSALPIIGIAPILVMWFGFDWPSKAAVVVTMTFFPMLVNTVAGLNASGTMERDLMRTYAAGYWRTLLKLRLPAAAPFIFNALKINSTLAMIGAIVAEFFGTPIVGMGFRISTEVGKLNIDLVWAEIAVAAVVGSAFYGVIALIERAVTFWHPSVRGARV
jgi:NitT/TauT family transport system permease protein